MFALIPPLHRQPHPDILSLSLPSPQAHVLCEAAGGASVRQLPARHGAQHPPRQPGPGAGEVLQGVLRLRQLWRAGVREAHAGSKDTQRRYDTQSLQK